MHFLNEFIWPVQRSDTKKTRKPTMIYYLKILCDTL